MKKYLTPSFIWFYALNLFLASNITTWITFAWLTIYAALCLGVRDGSIMEIISAQKVLAVIFSIVTIGFLILKLSLLPILLKKIRENLADVFFETFTKNLKEHKLPVLLASLVSDLFFVALIYLFLFDKNISIYGLKFTTCAYVASGAGLFGSYIVLFICQNAIRQINTRCQRNN